MHTDSDITRTMSPGTRTAIALMTLVLSSACGLPEGDYFGKVKDNPDPTHLRWCNSGEPEFIDPALVTSTTGVKLTYALFDGLLVNNLQGLPEASLSVGPGADGMPSISPDQRRFEFKLRADARWSNGRPVTSFDFAYHMARVLNPLTFSRNAETLWRLKNGEMYNSGRAKMVMTNVGPFKRGDIVELVGRAGVDESGQYFFRFRRKDLDLGKIDFPESNLRTSDKELELRDLWKDNKGMLIDPPADWAEPYKTVGAGDEVTIVEIGRRADNRVEWAYVHRAEGDGVYGWVPLAQLTGQPNGELIYTVRRVSRVHIPGVAIPQDKYDETLKAPRFVGALKGKHLLTLPEVLGIRTPDAQTLIMETWGPVPYMIDTLTQRAFRASPREAVSRWPLRWTRPKNIVTSGGFHLKTWARRDRIEMVRSETFWNKKIVKLKKFTAYSMNDQAASTNLYIQGGCDAITGNNIPSSYFPVLNGEKRGRPYKDYTAAPYLGIYFYLLNTQKLDNVHLRRALALGIRRDRIPKILHGGQTPSAQLVPGTLISKLSAADQKLCGVKPDQKGVAMIVQANKLCYVPPLGLSFDATRAKAELAKAREQMGDKFPSPISLRYNTGNEGHKHIAEYIQQQWRENLDLKVALETQEWKTFLKSTIAGEYQIARMGWIGNYPDPESEFLSSFKCKSPDNRAKWCNDKYDRLYKQAEATADRKQRLEYIRQAEKVMINEAPVIPLYVYTQHHLQKPYVRDLAINFPDKPPLIRAWIDPNWKANLKRQLPKAKHAPVGKPVEGKGGETK